MEAQKPSDAIETTEISSPSLVSPATDVHDGMESASVYSALSEESKPSFAKRIAEAFREGVASAKPDYVKRPEAKIPRAERARRQESPDTGILDKAIQEGGSAAASVGDKAAIAADRVVQLAKKVPAVTHRFAMAFREGAASVKPREGRVRAEKPRRSEAPSRPAFAGKDVLDSVLHPKFSAREILRGAIRAVKPGEVRGARRKIRMCKKRIHHLYLELGCEAVNTWGRGPVETEKVAGLLDEVRHNEEEIQKLLDRIAEIAAAKKTDAAVSQPAEEEDLVSPAAVFEPEPVVESEPAPQEEVIDVADQSPAEEPEPADEPDAAPQEEVIDVVDQPRAEEPALELMEETEAAPEEEAIVVADPAPSEETGAVQEKKEDTEPS